METLTKSEPLALPSSGAARLAVQAALERLGVVPDVGGESPSPLTVAQRIVDQHPGGAILTVGGLAFHSQRGVTK